MKHLFPGSGRGGNLSGHVRYAGQVEYAAREKQVRRVIQNQLETSWIILFFIFMKVHRLHNSRDRIWDGDSHAKLHLPVWAPGLGVCVLCLRGPGTSLVPCLVPGHPWWPWCSSKVSQGQTKAHGMLTNGRISSQEKEALEEALRDSQSSKPAANPGLSIGRSVPVGASATAHITQVNN